MILNIDFNPKIKEVYLLDSINKKHENKINSYSVYPRGSGYEINKMLNLFNLESILTGFLSEKYIKEYFSLMGSKTKNSFININDEIYKEVVLKSVEEEIKISTPEIRVSEEEIIEFYNDYHTLLDKAELVLCIENDNVKLPRSIYRNIIHIATMANKKCLLEIKNIETLDLILGEKFSCIMNKNILEDKTKLYLNDIDSIAKASNYLISSGIEEVFIILDGYGTIYSNKWSDISYGFLEKDSSKNKQESIGLISGLLIAKLKNYEKDMTFKLAQAMSSVYNKIDILEEINLGDIKKAMSEIEIIQIKREES